MKSQKVNTFQRCLDQPITGMRSSIKFKGLPPTSHYLHHIIAVAQFESEAACRMKRSHFTMPTSPLTVDNVGFDHNTGGRPGPFGLGFTKELQTHKQASLKKICGHKVASSQLWISSFCCNAAAHKALHSRTSCDS